jgi:hypothetical protein
MIEYQLRLWIGSGLFAFGIFGWTWFLRNVFKRRINKAIFYTRYHPIIHIFWNTFWVMLGLWIYPIENTFPLIPLILGIAIGLYISRSSP